MNSIILNLETRLELPIAKVWAFFSIPSNLKLISPSHMKFQILNGTLDEMVLGEEYVYRFLLLPYIYVKWRNEFIEIKVNEYFVDTMRKGPFLFWEHKHSFGALDMNTTLLKDEISFRMPFGYLGKWVGELIVKKIIKKSFEKRYHEIEKLITKQKV